MLKIQVHARALAAAYQYQAHNDVRQYLNGILIQPHERGGVHVVATNGHQLIDIHDPAGFCEGDVILQMSKTLPTKLKANKSISSVILIPVSSPDSRKKWRLTMINPEHDEIVRQLDGTYPTWQNVMSKAWPTQPKLDQVIDPVYFGSLSAAAQILHNGGEHKPQVAFMHGDNDGKASQFIIACDFGLHARGVIMPLQLRADMQELVWVSPLVNEQQEAA